MRLVNKIILLEENYGKLRETNMQQFLRQVDATSSVEETSNKEKFFSFGPENFVKFTRIFVIFYCLSGVVPPLCRHQAL